MTTSLLQGLYWHDLDGIRERHAAGADLNGLDDNGCTPLTEAISGGMGYPPVVKLLLELGADPHLADGNGLTPWLACLMRRQDRVVETEYRKIRKLLEAAKADRRGEELFDLEDKAAAGDLRAVQALLDKGCPVEGAHAAPLGAALFNGHGDVAELLLQRGASVEGKGVDEHGMTLLMSAANDGLLDMVQLLVRHGADVCRAWNGPDSCQTAAWYARDAGHHEVADWLAAQHPGAERSPIPKAALNGGAKAKYLDLYRHYTQGANHGLNTEAIVKKLQRWDKDYGIHVLDVSTDRLTVQFERLPDDLGKLAKDIGKFCPDTLDSFAAMAEQKTPAPDQQALLQGLDPADKHFAYKALQRWLQTHQAVGLWWD
ncbi:ankyrin repeat domain-containing protein [Pseudomonas sp. GD03944]|uniref:ankyrin repeat domain-containing protein n=1 Tax=Pseudomonas sp. GD03944 TaxID=2975409 RepID=UPI00244BD433|nr:ankyrin repeat domain-containing protein [Pseudomonas sp. GD03944]MDH1264470.1 ankyrin repeat domain-containing protein [Pseudomonas sp. GD03944]